MKSSVLKLGAFVFILALVIFGVKTIVTTPFFSDTETSADNILQVATSFPQTAPLYDSTPYTCPGGASNTAGPTFGTVTIDKDSSTLYVDVVLDGATPSSTYDIWVNQDPGACPLSSPSFPAAMTTDINGDDTFSTSLQVVGGATNFWISAVGGGQVLRSTAVSF